MTANSVSDIPEEEDVDIPETNVTDIQAIPTIKPSSLRFGRMLFAGRVSTVFSGKMVTSAVGPREKRRSVALKLLPPLSKSKSTAHELKSHLAVQARGNHPNIVQLFGYSKTGVGEEDPMKRSRGCLVMEHLAHLFSMADIQNRSFVHEQRVRTEDSQLEKKSSHSSLFFLPLTPLLAKIIFCQLFRALQHCHHMGICHGDVSPGNVMIDAKSFLLKLCDFGSAQELLEATRTGSRVPRRLDQFVGTDGYRAPEVLQGSQEYTTSIDLWSGGCLLAEMAGKTERTLFFSAKLGQDKSYKPGIGMHEQLETISNVLDISPLHSVRLEQHEEEPIWWPMLFDYPLPSSLVDLLSKLLVCNPNRRLDALEACAHPFFKEVRDPGAVLPNGEPLPELSAITSSCDTEAVEDLLPRVIQITHRSKTARRKWSWRKGSLGAQDDPLTWLPPLETRKA